jgi:hypothetical protein
VFDHAGSLFHTGRSESQRDQTRDEHGRQREAWLQRLRSGCPEAHERLDRFAVEWFADQHPQFREPLLIGSVQLDGLRDAATSVLSAIQQELLAQASPLETSIARLIARERFHAITALIYDVGEKEAKKLAVAVAGLAGPLTICTGNSYRIRGAKQHKVTTWTFGDQQFVVKGCGAIFPDSRQTSGNSMWPGFCDDCRSDRRKPHRDQERAIRRRLDHLSATATTYSYSRSQTLPSR